MQNIFKAVRMFLNLLGRLATMYELILKWNVFPFDTERPKMVWQIFKILQKRLQDF